MTRDAFIGGYWNGRENKRYKFY